MAAKSFSAIFAISSIIILLSLPFLSAQPATSFSNPSVIPGWQADLHGPRISTLSYPIFTSDHASLSALLAGETNIMDVSPSEFSDIETALSTNYLNVTSGTGSGQEFILFNMYSNQVPGYDIHFRQAIAHLIDYDYVQTTVLNGIQGIATPNILLPSLYGNYSTNDITTYPYSLSAANASLSQDPQLKWDPTAAKPVTSNTIACDGSPGVWQWANGAAFTPIFITRSDHPTWLTESEKIWRDAASIGLCLDLEQQASYGSIYPIIYESYNNNWAMYFDGLSYGPPVDAVGPLFYAYTKNPGWSAPVLNPSHFYNGTLEPILHEMYSTNDPSVAAAYSRQALQILSQQIPTLNIWWDSVLIPSLNNYNGVYWTGYVNAPGFSTWNFATGEWTTLNVHMVDPSTGNTITGGTFAVGLHEAPDDMNPFYAESVYDFDVINQIYDSPMTTAPGNPSLSGLIPWTLTSKPSVITNVTTTTPHGYRIVNGMTITLDFMNNITFSDNVRMTADDFNFSLWYPNLNGATYNATTGQCSAPCWTKYVNNSSPTLTDSLSDLTDSVVTSPTSVTVYMNGTGIEDYRGIVTMGIFPEHLWSQVNSTAFNNDIDPTSNTVDGAGLFTGTGPFVFQNWERTQHVTLYRNPGYFRTDIQDWKLWTMTGSNLPLSVSLLQQGIPIPTTANVNAYVLQNDQQTDVSTTLTPAGTDWNGTLNTSSLSPGFYEIVVNGTYQDVNMMPHEMLQFWGLSVGSTTPTAAAVSPTVSGVPSYVIGAVVIVIIAIIGLVIYTQRRSKGTVKKR